ncbi:MAG: Uncharacterized protein XD43_0404 [Thermococcales archaeon 44_46]|nr:MAG: Uncharacterized protein XD43_0404 [Thermococcales archaeon 44_46]HIH72981.1 glycosyltransferase family 4 protein [Thermococcaceae archaeon]
MKILFVTEYYPPIHMGGAEISLKILVNKLAQLGHEVTVITPNYTKYKTETEISKNLRVIRFKSWRYFLFKKQLRKISSEIYLRKKSSYYFQLNGYIKFSSFEIMKVVKELLQTEDFDVIHANNLESILALSKIQDADIKVAHLRDFALLCWNRGLDNNGKLCEGCSLTNIQQCMGANYILGSTLVHEINKRKNVLGKFDKMLAISNFVKMEFVKRLNVPTKKISVLYNPISPEIVPNISKEEARQYLNLPEDKTIVLFVGTLTELKGAHLIPKIAKEVPGHLFVVVGDGPLRKMFTKSPLKNVLYVGYQPMEILRHYYKASDILLVPSLWYEPFGRVIIEGAVNGCYVVGSDKGAIPELIHWIGYGTSVPPQSKYFAEAIKNAPQTAKHEKLKTKIIDYSNKYGEKFIKAIME